MIIIKRYIGCDPGKTGAMVCISENGVEIVPFEEEAYRDALERWSKDSCVAAIERVSAMPGQGVSSTFTFGQNFGYTQGLMYAFKIPVNLVSPAVWKKEFSVQMGKDASKAEKKAKTIACMKRLFPDVSLKRTERSRTDDDGISDALAIAEYCRRKFR